MKKISFKNRTGHDAKFFAALLFLSIALCFNGPVVFSQEGASQFLEIAGVVEIREPGGAEWKPAEVGMIINSGAIISTGFKGAAVIAIGNSTLSIRPLTRLSLEEIVQRGNDEEVKLFLHAGRVRAEVAPPSGGSTDFSVRSPSVTASVRGTAFEFDTLSVSVENGRVHYSGINGQSMNVERGERSYIDESDKRIVPPFETATALLTPALPQLNSTGASALPPAFSLFTIVNLGVGWEWP
jgi:hypothetical protein